MKEYRKEVKEKERRETKQNKKCAGRKSRIVPFVLLPEVAGEGDEQHSGESSESCTEPDPELHPLTWQRFLLRQGHTSHTQLGFSPHIQQVLRNNIHTQSIK